MKRLYIACALLAAVIALCVTSHLYLHHQIDRLLTDLDGIEAAYHRHDVDIGERTRTFADEYERVSHWISCYIAHGELRDGQESAALLPTLVSRGEAENVQEEIARLRAHLIRLKHVDDPILHNIL